MRGLYAIVDTATLGERGLSVVETARALVAARPAAVQLRAKEESPRETLALLRAIAPICRAANVPLYANDRADLAVLAGCDGVHVGQGDLPVGVVRSIAPGLRVGVSTHDLDQLGRALADRPDYVAYGPVFATRSKRDADAAVGLAGLAAAAERADVPLVAIGGIDLGRAPDVARHASVAAVIGALYAGASGATALGDVTERARALGSVFRGEA